MRKHVSFILLGMTAFLLVSVLVSNAQAATKDTLVFVMSAEPVTLIPRMP